jgi:hypothetical protein
MKFKNFTHNIDEFCGLKGPATIPLNVSPTRFRISFSSAGSETVLKRYNQLERAALIEGDK